MILLGRKGGGVIVLGMDKRGWVYDSVGEEDIDERGLLRVGRGDHEEPAVVGGWRLSQPQVVVSTAFLTAPSPPPPCLQSERVCLYTQLM